MIQQTRWETSNQKKRKIYRELMSMFVDAVNLYHQVLKCIKAFVSALDGGFLLPP
jgi:hypothetical protein